MVQRTRQEPVTPRIDRGAAPPVHDTPDSFPSVETEALPREEGSKSTEATMAGDMNAPEPICGGQRAQ